MYAQKIWFQPLLGILQGGLHRSCLPSTVGSASDGRFLLTQTRYFYVFRIIFLPVS
jgi:hypothetical protein